MQTEEESKMDYDELTLNPVLAEIEAETAADSDSRSKQRRYWTPKEEQRFFEIWGRDNWRLTRHGKNTIFFAKWSLELKDSYDIEVKPEEIQTKVNQTRAKFRQVKKQIRSNKSGARWKKFDIIDKILKNQYRPKDAEPVPKSAMENNRDIDSDDMATSPSPRPSSPTSITSNSNTQEAADTHKTSERGAARHANTTDDGSMQDDLLAEHSISTTLFSSSAELFNEHMDDVKTEFQNEYDNFAFQQQQQPNHYVAPEPHDEDEEPQLHQLQTPQQQLEQLQQQQQHYQQYRPTPSTSAPPPDTTTVLPAATEQHLQPQHLQQHATAAGYDHTTNAYAANHTGAVAAAAGTHNHYAAAAPAPAAANYNHQYGANSNSYNNGNSTPASAMQPPPTTTRAAAPRRRRTSAAHANAHNMVVPATGRAVDSIEHMYLEEVRKKNLILAEQKEIAFKRLQLDQRKVTLMEQFFPKCIELQEQILKKLTNS